MKDIRLYIADRLVDLDTESMLTLTYTLDDTTNPTIVKNMFSTSIALPCSPNNNAVFGRIYDLSRVTSISDTQRGGVYFNPLQRTPFSLYVEGDLVESGYIQLKEIKKTNGVPRYTIDLFGGIGDFFYALMYDENGEKRNLADLDYGISGAVDAKSEMDFNINRQQVATAWNSVGDNRDSLFDTITFVPAYNGVAKDFDSEHALVNIRREIGAGSNEEIEYLPQSVSKDGKTYNMVGGYGLATLPRPVDEWEARDLRSYLQRPALSVRRFIEACCNPANNGGYAVELDDTFFNENNALYNDAYITLPMLSAEIESLESSQEITPVELGIGVGDTLNRFAITAFFNSDVSLADKPIGSTIRVNVPLSLRLNAMADAPSTLYTGCTEYGYNGEFLSAKVSAYVAQLIVRDADTRDVIGSTPPMALSSSGDFDTSWQVYTRFDNVARGVVNYKGNFQRNGDNHYFIGEDGANTFPLELSFLRGNTNAISVSVILQRAFAYDDRYISAYANKLFTRQSIYRYGFNFADPAIEDRPEETYTDALYGIVSVRPMLNGSAVTTYLNNLPSVSTGTKVTKAMLLGGTASPADYLLSYTKLFGLRYTKDIATKTVKITSRFFNGNIENLQQRIDRGAEQSITPNVFDKKFMRLALTQPDTYFVEKYRNHNKIDYGQKRVDTGYSFNNDTEEVYSDNVYTSAVPCLATSRSFYNYYTSADKLILPLVTEGITLSLFNGDATNGYTSTDVDVPMGNVVVPSKTVALHPKNGYDAMPKMCYFKERDDEREAVDISNNLVIYGGGFYPTDADGTPITYWLTDDVPEMIQLNDAPCYLLTQSTSGGNPVNDIAIPFTRLPLFLSVKLSIDNRVVNSFDFAQPKEIYIPGLTYPETSALYNRYWAGYYADRMDVDTSRVVANVDLTGMIINHDALRSFYYFDSCIWLLNKINNYDPARTRLTKCEFIKVKDMSNYYTADVPEEILPPSDNNGFTYDFEFDLE